MIPGSPQRLLVIVAAIGALAACASAPSRRPAPTISAVESLLQQSAGPEDRARAAHALNRLAFGPRPGDVDRVSRMGVERWIAQQLRPETIIDSAGTRALDGCPHWTMPWFTAVASLPEMDYFFARPGDSLGIPPTPAGVFVVGLSVYAARSGPLFTLDDAAGAGYRSIVGIDNNQLLACRLTRLEASDQQLLEVVTDFWQNHFSVSALSFPSRGLVIEWDRDVIRPHALGRFRKLLGQVAHSPLMLTYLDNSVSAADADHLTLRELTVARAGRTHPVKGPRKAGGINENYGRELLELHTLGADGAYTQADVIEVARAFTGWTHSEALVNGRRPQYRGADSWPIVFKFDSAMHDADVKVVLGHTLRPGRGTEDGEEVLDILARHPSTARFIAHKLAVRFVSDSPPPALVERAAAMFRRTDGDIREVVRTIVTSPEFFDPTVHGAKIKSPQEFVLSTRRALAAPPDTAAEMIDFLIAMNQPPFGKSSPEGWPEIGTAWLTFGGMVARFDMANRIGRGDLASIPAEAWPGWAELADLPYEQQVDGVIRMLLPGRATAETRAVMSAARPAGEDQSTTEARGRALRSLIGLAIASPQFQRR